MADLAMWVDHLRAVFTAPGVKPWDCVGVVVRMLDGSLATAHMECVAATLKQLPESVPVEFSRRPLDVILGVWNEETMGETGPRDGVCVRLTTEELKTPAETFSWLGLRQGSAPKVVICGREFERPKELYPIVNADHSVAH